MSNLTRRSFLAICPVAAVPLVVRGPLFAGPSPTPRPEAASPAAVGAGFPTQEPELVREMVGVAHGNFARVKELVGRHETLAKAAVDWGFGDWESALGAASHVGNREIAEFLLAHGARPSIFSAAMLGQLEVVRAFVLAMPGIQKTKGPHSISLLRHAQAGGPPAQAVVDYLVALGGADERQAEQPLSADDVAKLTGAYAFGKKASDRIEIRYDKERLWFARAGGSARGLFHLGSFEFSPVGAEVVRIRFEDRAAGVALAVYDPDLVLTARKV